MLLRDRPWRVTKVVGAGVGRSVVEAEALDDDHPRHLAVAVPPEEPHPLLPEDLVFERSDVDSVSAWVTAHRLLSHTLVRDTALVAGARFGRVALEAYQLAPALRLLAKPRPSLLVADDVGLGKTIEAGLAMLELMARRRADRILVVTPSGLLDQWQDEMWEKFGLQFWLLDNAAGVSRAQTDLPAGVSPWDALPRVLTSIDFLKKDTVRARALRKRWDLVIVDEAHALAEAGSPDNPYQTQRTWLGLALRQASRGLLLLTATPHNGYSHSFRSLRELVEPTLATLQGPHDRLARRIDQALIRRDPEVDVADRLRELDDEEARAQAVAERTGQLRLFGRRETRGGYEARREAVRAAAEGRAQDGSSCRERFVRPLLRDCLGFHLGAGEDRVYGLYASAQDEADGRPPGAVLLRPVGRGPGRRPRRGAAQEPARCRAGPSRRGVRSPRHRRFPPAFPGSRQWTPGRLPGGGPGRPGRGTRSRALRRLPPAGAGHQLRRGCGRAAAHRRGGAGEPQARRARPR
ncbi:MAG: DEAD/DEAH box helicase [Candidatus Latescibacterota bacterium]